MTPDAPLDVLEQGLRAVSTGRVTFVKRKSVKRWVVVRVFRRDRFQCVYCERKVIFTPVLHLLGRLYPDSFPYDPHWVGGQTVRAVTLCTAVVDHVEPGAWGGSWEDIENLATACNPCNKAKGDFDLADLDWERHDTPPDPDWDGLLRFYEPLWKLVEPQLPQIAKQLDWDEADVRKERNFHEKWLKALARATA
jgi:5-methylcytosine-specific restriction endonuclease McrA